MSAPTAVRAPALPAALSLRRLEGVAVAAFALAASILASANLLRPGIVEGDALVHQYWMRRWIDPALFTDALTARLRGSERYPDGYQALFWLASHVTDPIRFGEWLGIALMATAGVLVFAIVREHIAWRPAAWLGGRAVPRAPGPPLLRRLPARLPPRRRAGDRAARDPPARSRGRGGGGGRRAVLSARGAAGGRRPHLSIRDRRRAGAAALAFGLFVAAVLLPRLLGGGALDVMSASEARAYPEFGEHGDLHFFTSSLLDYLRQNRSGFDLRATGSLVLLAALCLLAVRRANWRELRPEVIALPVAAVGAWALAQLTLFQLYLPHRYTYPLLAFGAIAVAVLLLPTWQALPARAGWRSGCCRSPTSRSGSSRSGRCSRSTPRSGGRCPRSPRSPPSPPAAPPPARCSPGSRCWAPCSPSPAASPPGQSCPHTPAMAYLASLPKDAVVAGDPLDLKCVPVAANRPVVISTQLAFSYERGYFREGRARMFDSLRAYYGADRGAFTTLAGRYGATHLLVDRRDVRRARWRWPGDRQPYGRLVTSLLAGGDPAILQLPTRCRRWSRGSQAVYELACLGSAAARTTAAEPRDDPRAPRAHRTTGACASSGISTSRWPCEPVASASSRSKR